MDASASSDSARSGTGRLPADDSVRERDPGGEASDPFRLLLVEDNPGDARLLEEYLSEAFRLPARLKRAGTLEEALDGIRDADARPDAVLLDLNLPDADGLDTVHRMVDAAPELPVIVLTGLDDRDMALAAVREGAQDYLIKGELDPELLARSVRYALERKRSERQLVQILDTVADGILFTDPEGEFAYANPAAEEILGLRKSAITGRTYRDPRWKICAPDGGPFEDEELPVARVLDSGEPVSEVEHGVERPDGSLIILRVNAAPMHNDRGELEGVVASIRDVTEQKEFEAQLEHRALYDHLTELPNRILFQDRLGHALHRAARTGDSLAVLFIDLKRFKVINDSMGHDAGDQVLVEIGDRLRSSVRDQDTVSRLGGDEFTLLLEDIQRSGNARDVVERIVETLREPVDLGRSQVTVDASIGVALHDGEENPEAVEASELVQRADRAMYRAKEKPGTNWAVAESGDEEGGDTRLERETRLRAVLEEGELRTVYHPIYDLSSGAVRGVEALARWTDPEIGSIPPGDFIPLAEETGLIVDLGEQQLERACAEMLSDAITVPDAGQPLHLNVNMSARQLEDPKLVERVRRILEKTGFPPARLYLEVTESAAMREPGAVEGLKGLGVGLAVDDFGTRYSTLGQVKRLTVDELKIDRSFVDGLPDDEKDRAIVKTVVTLATSLGLRVVAEGIETEGQLAAVRELGCQAGQGFLLSKPVSRLDDVPLQIGA